MHFFDFLFYYRRWKWMLIDTVNFYTHISPFTRVVSWKWSNVFRVGCQNSFIHKRTNERKNGQPLNAAKRVMSHALNFINVFTYEFFVRTSFQQLFLVTFGLWCLNSYEKCARKCWWNLHMALRKDENIFERKTFNKDKDFVVESRSVVFF